MKRDLRLQANIRTSLTYADYKLASGAAKAVKADRIKLIKNEILKRLHGRDALRALAQIEKDLQDEAFALVLLGQ